MNIYKKASEAWSNLPPLKRKEFPSFCVGYITAYAECQQEISKLKEQLSFEKGRSDRYQSQLALSDE